MSDSPQAPPLDLRQRAAAFAVRRVLAAFAATYRVRTVAGADTLEGLVAARRPAILCFWHDQLFFFAPFLRRLIRRGMPLTVFTSLSRDGELVAQLALHWGADAVRGSSSRGGSDALRQLYRIVKAGGSSPVIVPDGPRGPRHEAKPGAVILARMAGAPIVPLACAAAAGWRLGSWDRMLVPRPFTRVTVTVGTPWSVPREDAESSVEPYRARLESDLRALGEQAEAALR